MGGDRECEGPGDKEGVGDGIKASDFEDNGDVERIRNGRRDAALWSGINKNRDVSTGPLARPFARTAHSLACSGLPALLAPSAALTRSLAHSIRSLPHSWKSELLMSQNDLVLSHSAPAEDAREEEAAEEETEEERQEGEAEVVR